MFKSTLHLAIMLLVFNNLMAKVYPTFDLNGGTLYSKSDTFSTHMNVISPNFDLTWELNDNSLLSVGTAYSDFNENSIYNYLEPQLKFQLQLSDEEDEFISYFFSSLNAKFLTNSNVTTDVFNINIGYNYNRPIFETISLNASTGFKYKSFISLSEYNYAEIPLQFSLSTSFETKTSIKIDLGFSTKLYTLNEFTYIEPIQENRENSTLMGRNNFFKATQVANKFEFGFSVGQNVFETTGIGIKYKHSMSFENYNKYSPDYSYEFFLDSDLYNDPYSQNFSQYSVSLTQMLPFEIRLSLNYDFYTREYYSWISDLSREENMNSFSIDVSKSIDLENSFINTIDFYLYYDTNSNNSSIDYYNYKMNVIAIGLSLGF